MASLPGSARLLRALVVATCLFPVVQACGRSEPGDYLYNDDGTISVGASANTAGRSSTTGGTRNGTAGSTNTGANGTGANGTGANGTGATSPTAVIGGRGPIGVGGTSTGFGGSGPLPEGGEGGTAVAGTGQGGGVSVTPISCGDQICNAETQSCCAGLAGLACIRKGRACEGAVLGCTLNADCTGNDICCISITGDVNAASSCKASCDNMGTGRDRQLCQTDDECRPPFRFCTPTIFGVNICTRRP